MNVYLDEGMLYFHIISFSLCMYYTIWSNTLPTESIMHANDFKKRLKWNLYCSVVYTLLYIFFHLFILLMYVRMYVVQQPLD